MRVGKLAGVLAEAEAELSQCASATDLEQLRVKFLGRKSEIIAILRGLKDLSPEDKKAVGRETNQAKVKIEAWLAEAGARLAGAEGGTTARIDYGLPGKRYPTGKLHPITRTIREISDIFFGMGFEVALGPEIEAEHYNFGALNFPPDHPARDMQDTFYLGEDLLLRTHTSPIQIREMLKQQPPVRIIAPGRCYRQEAISARAYCVFYQIEGFYVDRNVSFADLKGVLTAFAQSFFGEQVQLRFRPSYFPFTEPSAEVDISCFLCGTKGCRICKYSGWLEILGCGMIDPNVMEAVDYDPEKYSGYAFGMGIERIAMLRHKIDDIRLLYENDLRFLRQF
jgi:phenylalanyl-tRNA synthetase alpha chain